MFQASLITCSQGMWGFQIQIQSEFHTQMNDLELISEVCHHHCSVKALLSRHQNFIFCKYTPNKQKL